MVGILEIRGKNKRVYIKNVDEVANMQIKIGDKFKLKGIGEFEVRLFLKGETHLWLDVE